MQELGMYWFVPKSGVPNLGDEFGRIVLEEIVGVSVVKKGLFSCDAISVGSILGWGWEKGGFKNRVTPLSVLGSGLMHPNLHLNP
ncbi:hypothetical protein [Vreelandella aquamarina]|uniref:Uncharacterized protein n=1 Tax=Vreelandella aquamarina TaxID=77097 RepID=A0A1H8PRM5_9GAMM|nr:hypothetical protein [Halomonas aquamarina]SEO44426.1 hypothetical protein SAMN04490369_10942 [Halomonas aquamarina]